jgi:hypothetical protein
MGKKNPGYYTPIRGMDPEKIHRALAAINAENGNQGTTVEEIARRSRVPLTKVRKEMQWGKNGNAGYMVIEPLVVGGKTLYRHTDRYDPNPDGDS